ncbi:HlyD family efflux transporter periplasmic adaptor subunit, partial [Oligoflexia bacterium]|nr:HlyD family efflux transporter periplasmic adaptor subunit [Oligoflexia bacterium]
SVDIGQVVNPQTSIAKLIGTDRFWIQVSVPIEDLQWLKLPEADGSGGSVATISRQAGKRRYNQVEVKLIKLIGDIRSDTRTARLLFEVVDPLGLKAGENQAKLPLLIGSWVDITIEGVKLDDVVVIPLSALREGERVWIMDKQGLLRIRAVDVMKNKPDDTVLLSGGIEQGERIVTSRISAPLPNMKLRLNGTKDESKE